MATNINDLKESMLCCSTAHISGNTRLWLIHTANESNTSLVFYSKGEYGWFIYVPQDWGSNSVVSMKTSDEGIPFVDDIPADLAVVMAYAAGNGCCWLCLDRDGPLAPLPIYND
jgi:hypothetical protein